MKKIILLITSILFSSLFYQNNLGLNIFIFSLSTTAVLAFFNLQKIKERSTLIKAVIYIITAVLVFFNHNTLSLFTNIISFFLFVGSISNSKSSIYIEFLNGLYTAIVAAFVLYFDNINNEIEQVKKQEINYAHWLKIIGIPIIVISVFIGLYRNANPVFDTIISKIDFSFINLQWLLFTALGYYLMYNITNPITIEPATEIDLKTTNSLNKNSLKELSEEKLKSENQLGLILMVSLNLLIAFLLITDVIFLTQNISSLSAVELSVQVHQGINALIVSIILAIALIIYFFRGNLNFYKQNKSLKTATFIWIVLNSILVIVTLFKNYQYVYSFGLTYKRIGVFIYLLLTFSGLLLTFIKIRDVKNIVFLLRKNIEIAFAVLLISSFINWDVFITKYNVNYVKNSQLDISYLLWLPNNSTILKKYNDEDKIESDNSINTKYNQHIANLENNSWQEFTFENLLNK